MAIVKTAIKMNPRTEARAMTALEEGAGGTTQKPEIFLISLPPSQLFA